MIIAGTGTGLFESYNHGCSVMIKEYDEYMKMYDKLTNYYDKKKEKDNECSF